MRTPMLVSLVLAVTLAGCGGGEEKGGAKAGPSAGGPSAAAPASAGAGAAGAKEFPAPSAWELRPLAVGQWIRVRMTVQGDPPTDLQFKIVGKEGNAFWYEVESSSAKGSSVIQVLLDEGIRRGYQPGSTIKKARVKAPGAPVQELSGPTLAMASKVVDDQIGLLGPPDLAKSPRADATTPVGTFRGCFVREDNKTVYGVSMKMKTWYHPEVPVMGFVRAEGQSGGKPTTMELLEVHETGAKSAM